MFFPARNIMQSFHFCLTFANIIIYCVALSSVGAFHLLMTQIDTSVDLFLLLNV